jgi:hypothetical protein
MKIPESHLKEVCKIGQGNECCRYITVGHMGIQCAKHTGLRRVLDAKVKAGEILAIADNCEGLNW